MSMVIVILGNNSDYFNTTKKKEIDSHADETALLALNESGSE